MLDDPRRRPLDIPQRRPSGILQIGAGSGLGSLPAGTRAILLLVVKPAVGGAGVNEAGSGDTAASVALAAAFAVDALAGCDDGEDEEEGDEGELYYMNG